MRLLGAGGELERVRNAKTCRLEERLAVCVSHFLSTGAAVFSFIVDHKGITPGK